MIRRNKVLYNSSSAGTGEWFRLDSRYEIDPHRSIIIDMNPSDSIQIEATTVDAKDKNDLASKIVSSDIVVLDTFTGSSEVNKILLGNYTYIRIVKTGTAGIAKVQGYI